MKAELDLARAFALEEDGVTAIEYGLLAGLIAISIIAGATAIGGGLNQFFTGVGNWFSGITVP
ncbi:Flp family type IVb pilin [Paraburkholderia phymatum]|uniref:Flp family type IVb pilin n=1 Tax=Paraburkholderia phymatum TaxID=148447 RepID=UPI003176FE30